MPSSRRKRHRRPGRSIPFRDPKRLILVVCEGRKTEPEYFAGFNRAHRNALVRIEFVKAHGVPRTLIDAAKESKGEALLSAHRERDDNLVFDSVWCVFDFDDHPEIPDALEMARANGIEVALSNPSFELWLLLHFRQNPGMQHRARIKEMLAEYVPGYDKSIDFADYSNGYSEAVTRARRLNEDAEQDGEQGRNPSTGVYRLTELIRAG